MLLAVDVGNSSTNFAVFAGAHLQCTARSDTSASRSPEDYLDFLTPVFEERGVSQHEIDAVAVASVVPEAEQSIVRFAHTCLGVASPLFITAEMDVGLQVNYHAKSDLGPDRIVNAAAAYAKYSGPVIAVDFGTATKLEAVTEDGVYLGGAIAPGVEVSAQALFSNAARLRQIPLEVPPKAIGDNTVSCMQSGIVYGFAGQVDGLVDRFREEIGGSAKVVATGGLAGIICPASRTIELCDPLLTLEGIRIIYERQLGGE